MMRFPQMHTDFLGVGFRLYLSKFLINLVLMNKNAYPDIKSMSLLLLVTDLDQSIRFYTEQLGFAVDFQYEDFYAGLIKDGCSLHLKLGSPVKEERENRIKNEDLDIVFSVSEIAELYEAMKGRPVNVIQSLREMPYGQEFYIADPDSYCIAFIAENHNKK